MTPLETAIHGALLGTIVGDAIGLPYEALSRRRGQRLLGPPVRHRFLLGRGMMSDDGEHACMVAQSLCVAGPTDVDRFRRSLAWRLRWWLLGVPAGAGKATAKATIKLWLGFPPTRSGVFSAGNGPAMRAAVLGAAIDDPATLRAFVLASTTITHTDPKAFYGAMAVAVAAREAKRGTTPDAYVDALRAALPEADALDMIDRIEGAVISAKAGEPATDLTELLGCMNWVSGYVYHTVPVAVQAWLAHPADFAAAVQSAIACGGDTDTVAAIAGGIVGAGGGADGVPADWQAGLFEWPRNRAWVNRLAGCLARSIESGQPVSPPGVGPLVIFRNLLFLIAVLVHLLRRALPPY